MKANEIREMSTEELYAKVNELKEQLFVLKFQQATGQQTEALKRKVIRKDIARILTIIKERELANK
ncbi:MAG: 50S ribosomal protein L29 [Bacilli bacterium]|nr:50S ribosomal protein L29 [Bacilli bacterium]